MNIVPPNIFSAYIKGGVRWPQIRGGINIFLLSSIESYHSVEKYIDWNMFIDNCLSEKQVKLSIRVMNMLHAKHKISLHKEVNMQDEWNSAKAAILKSFLHFFEKCEPAYNESIKELLSRENAIRVQQGTCVNKELVDIFFRMIKTAKNCLDSLNDMSDVFQDLIAGNNSMELDENKMEIFRKYDLPLSKSNVTNVTSILNYVENTLKSTLAKEFSQYTYAAFCWGFYLPGKSLITCL
jgi:hypothetical protein